MTKSSTKTRFQTHLEPAQLAALQRIQEQTGAPIAAQIRKAVDLWLKSQGAAPKKGTRT